MMNKTLNLKVKKDQETINDKVSDYIDKNRWEIKENSNMVHSIQGLSKFIAGDVIKNYWLEKVYTEDIRAAYKDGSIHIHDLSNLMSYCTGWDLYDLLMKGIDGIPNVPVSKPPKHLNTALNIVVNFMTLAQANSAGAVALSNFDTYLAPFIFYDNLDRKQLKQCLQSFIFNINNPTRAGGETVFSNITLDLKCPEHLKNTPVVIGGELQEVTYGDFSEEIELFSEVLFEIYLEGDGSERVFTFPIPTINIDKNFDWNNKKYKNLWEATAKYGIPYFANFINSDIKPEDTRSMCCRLKLDLNKIRRGGIFSSAALTGSIGVVTLNMSKLGHDVKSLAVNGKSFEDHFKERLDELLDISYKSLELKRKVLEELTESGLYPFVEQYLRVVKERSGEYWSNHFSTIGVCGMHEMCLNIFNKGIDDPEAKEFAKKVLNYIKNKTEEFTKISGNLYNLEATPAEGASYKFARLDKKNHPDMFCFKIEPKEFYTNSSQLPVDYSDDIISILNHQDEFQTIYTGGTVIHVFLGERIKNSELAKKFIKMVFENYELPYISLTPTFSICPDCGYLDGEIEFCKKCGKETQIYSRVVGYIRPVKFWNVGKQEEFKKRKCIIGLKQ